MTRIKKRNWGAVVYPQSAPADWIEILKLKGITFAVSPLHDKDLDTNQEIKKEHYHIIMCFSGPTTENHVTNLMSELNQPKPIALESVRGYYKYFTHAENPDKHQYDSKLIQHFNGFDVSDILNQIEVGSILIFIQSYIIENNITDYAVLMDELFNFEDKSYWQIARSNTIYLNTYLKSKKERIKEKVESSNSSNKRARELNANLKAIRSNK